jgi:outer membrane murein-binding lipoprotein Lpp
MRLRSRRLDGMTKRLVPIIACLVLTASVASFTVAAQATPKRSHAAPTLTSLNARIAVLENEVKDLRRSEFQNQLTAMNKTLNTLYTRVNFLCGQSTAACP